VIHVIHVVTFIMGVFYAGNNNFTEYLFYRF